MAAAIAERRDAFLSRRITYPCSARIPVVATPVDLDDADLHDVALIAARCGIRRDG